MRKIILVSFFCFQFCTISSQIKSVDDIQGDWTCVAMNYYMVNLATDEVYPNDLNWVTPTRNMQIKGNQVWMFDYPCEYFYTQKIEIDSGSYYYTRNEDSY